MTPEVPAVLAAGAQQLPGVFGTLEPVLRHYGYLAVAGVLFLEDFGVPLPGETILIAAALYAGTGRLDIWVVAVVAVVAAMLGDNVGFAIGHFGGRRLVDRYGRYVLLTPKRMDKAEGWVLDHGIWIVAVARFIDGLRQANGIVAGIVGMHWAKFLAANAVGAVLWVATWSAVGYLAGNHVEAVSQAFTYVAIGAGVVIGLFLVRAAWRAWHRRGERADTERRHAEPGTEEPNTSL